MPEATASLIQASRTWQQDGWVLLPGLLPADEVEVARSELQAEPLQPAGPALRAEQSGEVRFRSRQFDGTTLFPYPDAPALNRLFVHPLLVRFAQLALGTADVRIYQSRVWSKYGDHANYEQPHHLDGNHSLLPIRQGPRWGHLELFVYLHDVDDDNGAPRVVPAAAGREVRQRLLPDSHLSLGGAGTGRYLSREEAPELYENEVSAAGPAGSVFAYRSDVWHRGIDIPGGAERHIMVEAFRPAAVDWIGFDAHEPLVSRADFVAFAESCTPEELALFGVPLPGHEFWTVEVLDAMANVYPALDLRPWRSALRSPKK